MRTSDDRRSQEPASKPWRKTIADGARPDKAGLSAAVTRHSCSTPTLMPIRRLHATGAPRTLLILDPQRTAGEVEQILLQSRCPSALVRLPGPRHRSLTSTSADLPRRRRISGDAVLRFERADQHRRGPAFRLGHGVHQVVDAVIEVDVGDAGRAVERRVALGGAGRGVAGGIGFADVGLDFDDHARRQAARVSWTSTLPIRSRATSSVGRL